MKILLATSRAIPSGGGIASYNQELIKALGAGNDFYLLTSSNEQNVNGYINTESLYGINYYDYTFAKNFVDKINSANYDLVINSNNEFISIVSPFINSPIISVSHFVDGILADCAGYNCEYNNAIIALSYYGKKYIENKFHVKDDSKVKVVYNFVHPLKTPNNKVNASKITIVYPGGTSINKSVDVVTDVAYRLKQTKNDFSFIWLGNTILHSANMSLLGIKDIRQMLHGDSRFTITGNIPREEAEWYISSANVFLLPSRGEGCPMTLLEAMRAGCIPIVSDAHHGSLELIQQSKTGFVTKQGDSKTICKIIIDIINNPTKYAEYYNKTKEFSENELNFEKWTSKMMSIINETIFTVKKSIVMNRYNYNKSVNGYKIIKRSNRRKTILLSILNRVKMDWLYLKWKGWKQK